MNTPKFKERRYLTPESIRLFLEDYRLSSLLDTRSVNVYELIDAIGLSQLGNVTQEVLYHIVMEMFKQSNTPIKENEKEVIFWMNHLACYQKYVFELEPEQNIRYVVGCEYIDTYHRVVDGILEPAIWEFHDEREKG